MYQIHQTCSQQKYETCLTCNHLSSPWRAQLPIKATKRPDVIAYTITSDSIYNKESLTGFLTYQKTSKENLTSY